MAKNKNVTQDTGAEALENALTRTEQYIENNQKSLTIIVLAIVVIVALFLGYKRLYIAPMETEAQTQIFPAEYYFEKDSFNLALHGDGNYLGFIDIIESYGPTKTGNLAHYYAGICYRAIGEYDLAIEHLKKFNPKDRMIGAMAYGSIADCYVQIERLEDAAKYYLKAANYGKNNFSTPIYLMKAGVVNEELGKYGEAIKIYNRVKKEFSKSTEAREIEKYITRASLKM